MLRTLKAAFGLGLLVALTMSAIGVMSASATKNGHFTSDVSPTTLDISEVTGSSHVVTLSAVGSTVTCHQATYASTINGTTVEEITVTASYHNCTTGTGGAATVTMNGCHYVFTSRTPPNHGTAHFVCPVGASAQVHTGAGTLTFGAQTPSGGVTYKTEMETVAPHTKHAITAEITVSGITATCHGACQFISPTHINNATMNGSVTITGTDANKTLVNITAT